MKIIGITGKKRSGKNSLAEIIQKNTQENWQFVSFAENLREITSVLCVFPLDFDYERDKEEAVLKLKKDAHNLKERKRESRALSQMLSYGNRAPEKIQELFLVFLDDFNNRHFSIREFLQKLATDFGRDTLGENIWLDLLFDSLDPDNHYIITDMRFDNEAMRVKDCSGKIIEVLRTNYEQEENSFSQHKSERGISAVFIDLSLSAKNLEELETAFLENKNFILF